MRRVVTLVSLVFLGSYSDFSAYAEDISVTTLDICLLSWKADPVRTKLMPGQTYIPKEQQAYRDDSGSIVCARKYVYEYLCASFWRGGDDDWDRCAAERTAALIDLFDAELPQVQADALKFESGEEAVLELLQADLEGCGDLKDEKKRQSEASCKMEAYSKALAVLKFTRLMGNVQ